MFQSIVPVHNIDGTDHGRILPSEIPENHRPLNETEHILTNAVTNKNRNLEEGKNMFVSLVTGEFYVGVIEWIDDQRFTVGNSKPISELLIESAREV